MNNKILIISAIAWAIIAYSYQIGASAARCDRINAEIRQTIAQEQGHE